MRRLNEFGKSIVIVLVFLCGLFFQAGEGLLDFGLFFVQAEDGKRDFCLSRVRVCVCCRYVCVCVVSVCVYVLSVCVCVVCVCVCVSVDTGGSVDLGDRRGVQEEKSVSPHSPEIVHYKLPQNQGRCAASQRSD